MNFSKSTVFGVGKAFDQDTWCARDGMGAKSHSYFEVE
jgi:hypothetical protein